MMLSDILQIIKTNKFIVYGNGYIGKRFYQQIKNLGIENHVEGIAVTDPTPGMIGINGRPVQSIYNIGRNSLILIAAHDEVVREMQHILDEVGFKNIISIYPYLFEMEMGKPIQTNLLVEVSKLIKCLRHGYMPAIYYFTLKDFCGENVYNGKLYQKMCMFFMTSGTAEKRWKRYRDAIIKCKEVGFHQDSNIKICKDYSLIDGMHRLTLAKFFDISSLHADMYDCDGNFYSENNFGMDVCIHRDDLQKYYTKDEIKAIDLANREWTGKTNNQ